MEMESTSIISAADTTATTTTNASTPILPSAMLKFLQENRLPIELFTHPPVLPRFIRINPRMPKISFPELEDQFGTKLTPTALPSFLSLPSHIQIADKECYRLGSIYGMDLASGISVWALDPQPGENILDLCAAPGNKLAMIGDIMAERASAAASVAVTNTSTPTVASSVTTLSPSSSSPSPSPLSLGSVTGVDWNYQRLAGARTMLRKYELVGNGMKGKGKGNGSNRTIENNSTIPLPPPHMRFFLADGQTFSMQPPSHEMLIGQTLGDGHIVDLTNTISTISSAAAATGTGSSDLASSDSYHCASALQSSILLSSTGLLRINKRQKRAMKKQLAREEWKKRQKISTDGISIPVGEECKDDTAGDESDDTQTKHTPDESHTSATLPPQRSQHCQLYDRVLVDAECTHDGSHKHITKLVSNISNESATESSSLPSTSVPSPSDSSEFESKFLDPARLESLQTLQRNLIRNGFANLRPGGILIYSTCSYARKQNEEIIQWLIDQNSAAIPVHVFDGVKDANIISTSIPSSISVDSNDSVIEHVSLSDGSPTLSYRLGSLSGTMESRSSVAATGVLGIRLDPIVSGTSGLYVAKIKKRV